MINEFQFSRGITLANSLVHIVGAVLVAIVVAAHTSATAQDERTCGSSWAIQLLAARSLEELQQANKRFRQKHFDELDGKTMCSQRVDFQDRGTFYRLLFGPYGSRTEAQRACDRIAKSGTACLILSP